MTRRENNRGLRLTLKTGQENCPAQSKRSLGRVHLVNQSLGLSNKDDHAHQSLNCTGSCFANDLLNKCCTFY